MGTERTSHADLQPPSLLMQSATAQRALIAQRQCSCVELMQTTLDWIATVNPVVNAICTLEPETALAAAAAADQRLARGAVARPLEGLPIAIKDLAETRGLRTTYGSPLFADHVPAFSALHVERIEAAGAIVIGKTNVPEFGAGSQTFNTLFGTTVNPYDIARTAGGSSGGAAAALAARMLAIADGTDLGGSLRNPAAFCNVAGFRGTPGSVPMVPAQDGYNPLPICGPMARTVTDLGLLLSVMAGFDARAPLARTESAAAFAQLQPADLSDLRMAVSEDLGLLPVEPAVRARFAALTAQLAATGAAIEATEPALQLAFETFLVLRAQQFVSGFGSLYERSPDQLKDTIRWNIEQGLAATPAELARAQANLTTLRLRLQAFFADRDVLLLPTVQMLPFDHHIDWPRSVAGVPQDHYLGWMASCWLLTVTGCPCLSIPGGFSDDGLPVGLQIVGPPGADQQLLQVALAIEQAIGGQRREPDWAVLSGAATAPAAT